MQTFMRCSAVGQGVRQLAMPNPKKRRYEGVGGPATKLSVQLTIALDNLLRFWLRSSGAGNEQRHNRRSSQDMPS